MTHHLIQLQIPLDWLGRVVHLGFSFFSSLANLPGLEKKAPCWLSNLARLFLKHSLVQQMGYFLALTGLIKWFANKCFYLLHKEYSCYIFIKDGPQWQPLCGTWLQRGYTKHYLSCELLGAYNRPFHPLILMEKLTFHNSESWHYPNTHN